jgi:serine/threonine-protein kinase RsbW
MSVDAIVIERIEIDSDLSNLSIIESLIDKLCVSIHMNEDLYGNVLISVTEAFNNAVIHGNLLVHTKKVLLEVFEDDASFSFKISDFGIGFNFLDIPDPTSPENLEKENGRGIFLIKNLSDDISFTNNGSTIIIKFNKNHD